SKHSAQYIHTCPTHQLGRTTLRECLKPAAAISEVLFNGLCWPPVWSVGVVVAPRGACGSLGFVTRRRHHRTSRAKGICSGQPHSRAGGSWAVGSLNWSASSNCAAPAALVRAPRPTSGPKSRYHRRQCPWT